LTMQTLWNKRCRNCNHKQFTIWVVLLEIRPWITLKWVIFRMPWLCTKIQQLPQATVSTTLSQQDKSRGNLEGL